MTKQNRHKIPYYYVLVSMASSSPPFLTFIYLLFYNAAFKGQKLRSGTGAQYYPFTCLTLVDLTRPKAYVNLTPSLVQLKAEIDQFSTENKL